MTVSRNCTAALIASVIALNLWQAEAGAKETNATSKKSVANHPTVQTAIDPSVIDPVGKLAEISSHVSQSSNELAAISQALSQLDNEISNVDKKNGGKVSKASLDSLQKRFKATIARSYVVEKRVKDSLAKSQADIKNVRLALTAIQKDRASGNTRRPVMSDAEINECLKDLEDLSATIKDLQKSLVDNADEKESKSSKNSTK